MNKDLLPPNSNYAVFSVVDKSEPRLRLENIAVVDVKPLARSRTHKNPRVSNESVDLGSKTKNVRIIMFAYSDDLHPLDNLAEDSNSEFFPL